MLFLLSKVSKDMHQSIVPILFSLLESHASGAEFMRPDQKWKEMYGIMGNLVADRRRREGPNVRTTRRALCCNFRQHDEKEPTKLGARTRYLNMPKMEMADRVCSGYRKTAKWFTSRNVRLTAPHLGELPESPGCQITCGIVWFRNVRNRMIAACTCRTFVV